MSATRQERGRFPRPAVWTVLLVCALAPVLNAFGVDFGIDSTPADTELLLENVPVSNVEIAYRNMRGAFVYTLLEWTAFCVALVTVVFSVVYYFLMRDIITPVFGTALFFSGCMDGFQVLAADMITESGVRQEAFVPLAWMLSRTVNAMIVLAGTTPFLWQKSPPQSTHGLRYTLLVGVLFALVSYTIIHLLAGVRSPLVVLSAIPGFIHRPLDLIPLAMYLLAAGIVLPRFNKKHRSLFAKGLRLSVFPHIVSQCYAVTSSGLYDNAFNVAIGMKIVGYLVPLIGLIVDYYRSYGARVELHATRQQLRLARDIQMSLLPETAPQRKALDVAGQCQFAEVVGGDYFDYLHSGPDSLMVVIADVSGHDVGASLLMANTRSYLRVLAESSDNVSQISARVNEFLSQDARSRRFVTMFLARIDTSENQLHYVGAGHEAYVFRGGQSPVRLESTGTPLGVSSSRPPSARSVSLQAGDVLLMATDGVFEARNASGDQFGLGRVEAVISSNHQRPAKELLNALFSAVSRFRGRGPFDDDATALVVKVLEPASTAVVADDHDPR